MVPGRMYHSLLQELCAGRRPRTGSVQHGGRRLSPQLDSLELATVSHRSCSRSRSTAVRSATIVYTCAFSMMGGNLAARAAAGNCDASSSSAASVSLVPALVPLPCSGAAPAGATATTAISCAASASSSSSSSASTPSGPRCAAGSGGGCCSPAAAAVCAELGRSVCRCCCCCACDCNQCNWTAVAGCTHSVIVDTLYRASGARAWAVVDSRCPPVDCFGARPA